MERRHFRNRPASPGVSDAKFREIFWREIFHEIFREIFLKYFKNFKMLFFRAVQSK